MHPAKLFVNSFDKNGTVEPVRAYQTGDGKLYPYYLKTYLRHSDIVAVRLLKLTLTDKPLQKILLLKMFPLMKKMFAVL